MARELLLIRRTDKQRGEIIMSAQDPIDVVRPNTREVQGRGHLEILARGCECTISGSIPGH